MRMSSEVKERKVSQSAPSKIDSIVRQLFLPMLSIPTPEYTSFLLEDSDDLLVYRIARDKPDVVGSEAAFIEYMLGLYQKFQAQVGGAATGASSGVSTGGLKEANDESHADASHGAACCSAASG
jgi:hypothetical protein